MISLDIWKKAWAILEPAGRRSATLVLVVVLATGFFTAVMVASILPFLTVLSDPTAIERTPALFWIYDTFGFTSTKSFTLSLGIGSLVLILLATITQIGRAYIIATFSATQSKSISTRLLSNYLRQPYLFFLDRHTGDLGTHILALSGQVVDQFLKPAAEIIAAFCTASAILALLLWVSPTVSLVCILVLGGVYGTTFALTRRKIARLAQRHFLASKERYRVCIEAIGGIKAIKILNREDTYIDRFEPPSHDVAHAQKITSVTSEVPNYVLQALAFGGIVSLALYLLQTEGGNNVEALGKLLPTIGLIAFAGQRLLPELQRIYAGLTEIQHGNIAVAAVHHDLVENDADTTSTNGSPAPMGLRKNLELSDVSFRYPNSEQSGIFDLSLTIRAGERVGIVGTTGAGKSTLADLILGLIQPDRGQMVVDGVPIGPDTLRSWQKSIGYVPQDIFLADASVAENVALGCVLEEIDMARVKEACRIARIKDTIESEMPDGYLSMVGERGVRLSGGQKQRIGIARAIYNESDLLVFDEATSALDMVTEREVMAAIDALSGEKTVLLIAHRLSTVRSCDRIVVLDKGRLSMVGTWDNLEKKSPLFQSLNEAAENDRG